IVMKKAAAIMGGLAGITGVIQLALGIVFWTGHALTWTPVHMAIGSIFVIALLTLSVLGAVARLHPRRAVFAFVWALVVPALGMARLWLLPGQWHWVIRVLHLVVGIVAMNLAGMLAADLTGRAGRRARAGRRVPSLGVVQSEPKTS